MHINYQPPQLEFFPSKSATLPDDQKHPLLLSSLTLSTENLVILAILGIMIALFSFSLGVERGKMVAAQSLDEKVAAVWNVGGRRLAAPQTALKETAVAPAVKVSGNGGLIHSKPVIAKASTAAAASPVAASGNKWTVQLGTYRSEKFAKQEALGLKAKGFPVFLIKSKDFYLVCVGQFASQAQADALSKKFPGKYQGSPLRRF